MSENQYVIGLDYGTDSVRTVIINTSNGDEVASSVFSYPRWTKGLYCDPAKNLFRQHPLDYLEGLEITVKECLSMVPQEVGRNIKGIAVDTTGSTPVAVNRQGTPLSLTPGFEENPNAMFILWKDHTSVKEAEEINRKAKTWGGTDYTKFEGGVYSSEWFWAKILHILRDDPDVAKAAWSWVEHCDWMPALLTGNTDPLILKRSRCAAGHKAMWHKDFNGLPEEKFLIMLDPLLKGLRERLYTDTFTSDVPAGTITREWADRLGLPDDVVIGVGAFDAHMGAVGGEIEPYHLSKIVGTSTCDMLIAPMADMGDTLVKGICGQVDGSITPGMLGLEAGQSAFGDVYAWFKNVIAWPVENILTRTGLVDEKTRKKLVDETVMKIIPEITGAAEKIPAGESGIIALDWMNGRRTPDANQALKGAITGLTLGSHAPKIFRALVEATAFGSKKIVERFESEGVRIDGVIALGGVARKSPFVMQVLADVLNRPIKVARSEQTVALGAAMFATTAAGIYKKVEDAQKAMGSGFDKTYHPNPDRVRIYQELYDSYGRLGDFVEKETSQG
ncbi:MAG: ribulokinase [Bacteroides sp. SM23_62_1]|nr:MAG: ribulokinase [Bacteroides sp. SM23_62_1]